MAVFFPDILENNNSNYPLVDVTFLKGNSYPIDLLANVGNIPVDKRKIGTIVFTSSSQEFYGYISSSVSDWTTLSNWVNLSSGGTVDTGSLLTTGSVSLNTLTFTKGDGSTFDLIVNTGSSSNPTLQQVTTAGSSSTDTIYVAGVSTNYVIPTGGDLTLGGVTGDVYVTAGGAGDKVIIDGQAGVILSGSVNSQDGITAPSFTGSLQGNADTATTASYAITSSHTPEALVTASLAGSNLTFTKGDSSQFILALPGGGGGNPITGSYTGSLLTTNIQSINWTGSGVQATVGGANDITIYIPGAVNTGSLLTTGSVSLNTLTFTKGDGSTFDLIVDTGSAASVNTGSFMTTSSIADATITFTKGDSSTFDITVNNVVNAISASYATTASYTEIANIANTASYAVFSVLAGNAATADLATTASYVLNAVSASYAPNIYNTDGTLNNNRTIDLNNYNLNFDLQGGSSEFILRGDGGQLTVKLDSLPTNTLSDLISIDNADNKLYITPSSDLTVASSSVAISSSYASTASYAPNLYNSNGTLSGDRVVTFGGNDLRFHPGAGEFRVSDGPAGGPFGYEIVMSGSGEFRVNSPISSSFFTDVFVDSNKVLTLGPVDPLPSGVPIGSFAVSASTPPRPYMWDGSSWYAL